MMKVRPLRLSDIPTLKQYAQFSGFEYPDPSDPMIEKILVVADDEDRPIVAIAAKRLVEVYGWMNPEARASLRVEALRAIEKPMAEALKGLGYDTAEVFIPKPLERRGFGRFLRDRFGFTKNLISYGKRVR